MNKKNYSLAAVGGLAALFFTLIGLFAQPGEIDLITPAHSDWYLYTTIADSRWQLDSWLAPRPLLMAFLHFIGLIHQPEIFFFLLAMPAFCFVTLLPHFVIREKLCQSHVLPLVGFFLVAFGSPMFYPHFQLDFGGMLSGCFAVLAISFGCKAIKEVDSGAVYWWFFPIFFTMLSVETKPNYSFLLLSLTFCGALFIRGSRTKWLFIGVLLVLCWVFVKDKFLGSTFLATSDAASPYAVVLSPMKNIEMLMFYMKSAFTVPLALVTLVACITLLVRREWKLFSLFMVLVISASMPMALLVNRPWDTYAWYSTVVVGVLIMVAMSRLLVVISENKLLRVKVLITITLMSMFIGLAAHASTRHTAVEWTLTNQHYNRNVMTSLELINGLGGPKILLTGIQGPYHPLKNTKFVERFFPGLGKFDVLLRKKEREWNEMSDMQTNGIYLDEVNWSVYSNIYHFDKNGKYSKKLSSLEVGKMSYEQQVGFLYCNYNNNNTDIKFQDPTQVAKLIECLNNNHEFDAAVVIGTSSSELGNMQPWIYYHLAKSFQARGDFAEAVKLLSKALEVEANNPVFLAALAENTAQSR